jgi:hypothetical protein
VPQLEGHAHLVRDLEEHDRERLLARADAELVVGPGDAQRVFRLALPLGLAVRALLRVALDEDRLGVAADGGRDGRRALVGAL